MLFWRNICVGDVVFIKDDNLFRNEWCLVCVVWMLVGNDGYCRILKVIIGF